MKKSALSLALIIITGSMAGCLADGSDGVPEITLSDEDVIAIFDDNFADFVNNSSVTVINEIHYHNNTTTSVVNHNSDTSTSEISVQGSEGSGMLHVLDIEFDFDDLVNYDDKPDFRNRTFIATNVSYYDAALDQMLTADFTISCMNYYLVGIATGSPTTWWQSSDNYNEAWDQAGHNETIKNILWNGNSRADYCNEERWLGLHNGYVTESVELHTLDIPPGYALNCNNNIDGYDGTTTNTLMLTSPNEGESWSTHNPHLGFRVRISMEEPGSGYTHNCAQTYGNGTAMDYTISVTGIAPEEIYRLVFYYELVPVIGVGSEVTYGEWINEIGDTSEPWTLTLENNEWIEVKSAISLGFKDDRYYNYDSYILSDSGYDVREGFSPIYGGTYSFCGPEELESYGCRDVDNDGDISYDEWSIIYRIHNV